MARRQQAPAPRLPVLPVRRPGLLAALAVVACLAATLPFALSGQGALSAAAQESVLLPVVPPVPATPPAAPARVAGPGTPLGDGRVVRLTVGGLERAYVLLPALDLPAGEPAALLVVLHQDVGSASDMSVGLGLDDLRRKGVTLAYPAGYGGSWNSGGCCGVAQERDVDDVAFVSEVLDDVGRRTPVDPARRALLGYSGGGMLAYRMLCEARPPVVAVVEVNGSLEVPCPGGLRLPDLLSVHGEKDGSVGLTEPRFVTHLGMAPRDVTSTLDAVTRSGGCGERERAVVRGVDLWTWDGCRGGATVAAQVVPGVGHVWGQVGGAARATAFLLPRLTGRR